MRRKSLELFRKHRIRRVGVHVERLETRLAMAADFDASHLISLATPLDAGRGVRPIELSTRDMTPGVFGTVTLGFQTRDRLGDGRPPAIVAVEDAGASSVAPRYRRPRSESDPSTSIVLYELNVDRHDALILGDQMIESSVTDVFLPGDLDGDGSVGLEELNRLRRGPLLGSSQGDPAYELAADVNRDGRITSRDYTLARRNFGVQVEAPEPFSIGTDSSLAPAMPQYFGDSGLADPNRPLSRLRGPDGTEVDFVANELIVMTEDDAVLQALLARHGGTVIASADPGDAGLTNLPSIHLVRIADADSPLAGSEVEDRFRRLDPAVSGSITVSNTQGLHLLGAAAAETLPGTTVGINFIGQGHTYRDFDATESNTTGSGIPSSYDPNAFTWPHLSVGSNQDIGVTAAWQALETAGRLRQNIDLAILDMGFIDHDDVPSGATSISNVPFVEPLNNENFSGCGDSDCRWHGTNVLDAAAAIADNRFGAAGPAGDVIDPIRVFTLYDNFSTITALMAARAAGADIANMSYSMPIPLGPIADLFNAPNELTTAALRGGGMLLFASAGNEGDDVDDSFLGIEWTNITPLENEGVIGVGGMAFNDTVRDGSSNYGSTDVDIYAPFFVYVGPDPDTSPPDGQADTVELVAGTSFSSPFAAGVAALIWAADPSQDAGDVENVLFDTSLRGRSIGGNLQVNRYVNAAGAVDAVLNLRNQAPQVVINQVIDGRSYARGRQAVALSVTVFDFETPSQDLRVRWFSDRDGLIATNPSSSVLDLDYGQHNIRVEVSDGDGRTTIRQLGSITITNDRPEVEIISPNNGQVVLDNQVVRFRADAVDLNEVEQGRQLRDDQVSWQSNLEGFLGRGREITTTLTTIGTHVITATGTDSLGLGDADTINVTVRRAIDTPPEVQITAPNQPFYYFEGFDAFRNQSYIEVTLRGVASDNEDGSIPGSQMRWSTNRSDLQNTNLGTGQARTVRLYGDRDINVRTTHRITLTVTDSDGNTVSDTIEIRIDHFI